MNKYIIWTLIFLVILTLSPLLIYFLNFSDFELSKDNEVWGQFGNYLNGTLTPIIALVGASLAFTLGVISHNYNKTLLDRQEKEKRPLANIGYTDFEERLEINLRNKGLGPLIIKEYRIINIKTQESRTGIFDWISDIGGSYNNYTGNQNNLVLTSGGKINLFRLEGNPNNPEYITLRDKIRERLGDLLIEIEYNDIYDKTIKPKYERSLKWFGRHNKRQPLTKNIVHLADSTKNEDISNK